MAEETRGAIIGRNIRAVRDAGLYTRNEIARRSGVSASAIEDLELGMVARPRRGTIDKLAQALGVDAETLMEGAEVGDAPLGAAVPPSPEIPDMEIQALRRWMDHLEPRLAGHDLNDDELTHEMNAVLAIGSARMEQLPQPDKDRYRALVRSLRDEGKQTMQFNSELADLDDELRGRPKLAGPG